MGPSTAQLPLLALAVFEGFAGEPDRLADVADGAGAHALGEGIVLALLDVLRGLLEQVDRGLDPIAVMGLGVDRRMVVERLAVVDRRLADLLDGGVDLADRALLVPLDLGALGRPLEERARRA